MQRRSILVVGAALAFVGGWVLPVIDDHRGWQAFRVALSPVWPYENFGFEREGYRKRHYERGGELVDAILMAYFVEPARE